METISPVPADVPGDVPSTRPSRRSASPTRRENIFRLVDMLLQGDGEDESDSYSSSGETNNDTITSDEHLQQLGAKAFRRLQRSVDQLDDELRSFENAAQQLGSSMSVLFSAFHFRERLAQILSLFQQNSADLFPRTVTRLPENNRRSTKPEIPLFDKIERLAPRQLDLVILPNQLEALANEASHFLVCLNEFTEYTDASVNASVCSFVGDLKYWASCLRALKGQSRHSLVQRYIHELSTEMGDHMANIASSLSTLVKIGIPTIRSVQSQRASNLLNLSTVAALFSAVTATALQFSFQLPHSALANTVNSLWFSSLVFSSASAVNSLLGVTWKQVIRSPGNQIPWLALTWIKYSPLVFLMVSVACFSAGLCCFAFATNQAAVTSTLTVVFVSFTSLGLITVLVVYAIERAILLHKGKKGIGDILDECCTPVPKTSALKRIQKIIAIPKYQLNRLASFLQRTHLQTRGRTNAKPRNTDSQPIEDLEANSHCTVQHSGLGPGSNVIDTLNDRRPAQLPSKPLRTSSPPAPTSSATPNGTEAQPPGPHTSPGNRFRLNALPAAETHTSVTSPPALDAEESQESHMRTTFSHQLRTTEEETERAVARNSCQDPDRWTIEAPQQSTFSSQKHPANARPRAPHVAPPASTDDPRDAAQSIVSPQGIVAHGAGQQAPETPHEALAAAPVAGKPPDSY